MWRFFRTERLVLSVIYGHLGPLGVFCRFFNQFPIRGSLQGQTLLLTYSWLGLVSIFTVLLKIVQLLALLAALLQCTGLPGEIVLIYSLYHATLVVSQTIIHMSGWQDLCDLEERLTAFDSLVYRVPIVAKVRPLYKGVLWLLVPVMHYIFNNIGYIMSWEFSPVYHTVYFLTRTMFYVPSTIQCSLFLLYCSRLRWRIVLLQRSWMDYLKMAAANNNGRHTLHLDHYRHLHTRLVGCVDALNAAFGMKLAFTVVLIFVNTIQAAYYMKYPHHRGLFFCENIWIVVAILLVSYWSSDIHKQARLLLEDIFDIKIVGLNHCLRSQLDLLVYESHTTGAEIKVAGVVNFSKGLIGSITTSLVTYFILATQLAITIHPNVPATQAPPHGGG